MILPILMAPFACQAPMDLGAEESAIRQLESEWSKAAQSKDVASFVSYYSQDASVFVPNAPIASGPAAIRNLFDSLMKTPGFSLTFASNKVVVARGADMAHTQGTYKLTMNDAQGQQVVDTGKFVVVWRKQPNGSWKVLADIFNSDLPAAPLVR